MPDLFVQETFFGGLLRVTTGYLSRHEWYGLSGAGEKDSAKSLLFRWMTTTREKVPIFKRQLVSGLTTAHRGADRRREQANNLPRGPRHSVNSRQLAVPTSRSKSF